MKNFTIKYPSNEVRVLGTLKTRISEWNELPYPTKVLLLGRFVKEIVPEYLYEATDFIPDTDKPWTCKINGSEYRLSCIISNGADGDIDNTIQFLLERVAYSSAELLMV